MIQWPDGSDSMEGVTNDKVPTRLAYNGKACKWGFQIPEGQQRYYHWFKLKLDPKKPKETSHLTIEYPHPNALPTSLTKTAEALSIDFLSHLREQSSKSSRQRSVKVSLRLPLSSTSSQHQRSGLTPPSFVLELARSVPGWAVISRLYQSLKLPLSTHLMRWTQRP